MKPTITNSTSLAAAALVALLSSPVSSAPGQTPGLSAPQWAVFTGEEGIRVDYPENIFSVDGGLPPRGTGRVLRAADGRALLMVYTEDNEAQHTPASFVRTHFTGSRDALDYNRVTSRFFALSGVRDDLVFYSRCNFADGTRGPAHCIYIAYPKDEVRRWDQIVTRISLSLRPLH